MATQTRNYIKKSDDKYENLKCAVIYQACVDYFDAYKKVYKLQDAENARKDIAREMVRKGEYTSMKEVEKIRKTRLAYSIQGKERIEYFFRSDWWWFWTTVEPDIFLDRIKKMVKDGKRSF